MKRVYKLTLIVLLIFLSSNYVFAQSISGGEQLINHKFIEGKTGNTLNEKLDLNAPFKRDQLAAILAELTGEKESALNSALNINFVDKLKISNWAVFMVK